MGTTLNFISSKKGGSYPKSLAAIEREIGAVLTKMNNANVFLPNYEDLAVELEVDIGVCDDYEKKRPDLIIPPGWKEVEARPDPVNPYTIEFGEITTGLQRLSPKVTFKNTGGYC
jgi:hypothetical protein